MHWSIIDTEKQYQLALNRLEEIFDCQKGDPDFKEAQLIVMLVERYEAEHEPAFENPDPIEAIKFKMEQNNLKSKDLAEILGSKSKASEVLNRKRRLTLSMIRKISKYLHIPADTLISDYDLIT